MPPKIATLVYILGIWGLFWLDRDRGARTSNALWIPVSWLMINGSQTVAQWLGIFGFGYGGGAASPDQYLEGSPLDRNIFLALTLLGIFVLVKRSHKISVILQANIPMLLFFLYCAISVVWSDFPDVAFKRWTKAVGDLVMVLIVLTEANRSAAIKRFLSRVGFVLLPLSILFIKYYPEWGRNYANPMGAAAYVGVTTNKNILGLITMIFGLGSWWAFVQAWQQPRGKHRTRSLIAHGALLAMAGWLFWTVNSATALSCFIMGTGLIAITSSHRLARKPAVVFLLVLAVVSVSLFALFNDSGGGLLGAVGRESTLTGRTDIWKLVLGMAGNPVVGTGFESFWLGDRLRKVWNIYRFHLNEAHNGYIEVYLNLGWAGITLLGLLLVTGYRNLMIAFRREPEIRSLRLAFFVVAVVYNLTESGIRAQNPIWILFLLVIVNVPRLSIPRGDPLRGKSDSAHPDQQSDDLIPAGSPQEVF
ncbi:MAG: O-antigen ligase family protein [Terriglobales bacterium]